jgi:protoporphyrinogen oxidase
MSALSVVPMFVKWEAKYGSLTRATWKELKGGKAPLFTTLKGGMQSLVDELVRQLKPDVLQGTVEKIERGYRVRVNGDWLNADQVVIACRASTVLPDLFPAIPYNSASWFRAWSAKAYPREHGFHTSSTTECRTTRCYFGYSRLVEKPTSSERSVRSSGSQPSLSL